MAAIWPIAFAWKFLPIALGKSFLAAIFCLLIISAGVVVVGQLVGRARGRLFSIRGRRDPAGGK
jgi:hypothetical protein